MKNANSIKSTISTLKLMFKYTYPLRIRYFSSLVIYGFMVFLGNFVLGQSIRVLMNNIENGNKDGFVHGLVIGLVLIGLISLFNYISFFFLLSTSDKIMENLYNKFFKKSLAVNMKWYDNNHSGDLQSRLTNDMRMVTKGYRLDFQYILALIINGIGSVILIFTISLEMALIAISLGIIGFVANTFFINPIKKHGKKIAEDSSSATQLFSDNISGLKTIRVFNLQKWYMNKFNKVNNEIKNTGIKKERIFIFQGVINGVLGYINTFLVLFFGIWFVYMNKLSMGNVLAIVQYSAPVTALLINLGAALVNLQWVIISFNRINEVMNLPEEAHQDVTSYTLENKALSFENIGFSYGPKEIIRDLNFTINHGDVVILNGESGKGKSTILKLILKFYKANKGKIYVYGNEINDYNLETLRDMISYVSQTPYLFKGTIKENIKLGNLKARKEEILKAAKNANIHDFISSLPNGYNTDVGENGNLLSGGQKQKIAIAGAFLKDSPIILLDEITSSLDNISEKEINSSLKTLMKDKTVLIVCHKKNRLIESLKDYKIINL